MNILLPSCNTFETLRRKKVMRVSQLIISKQVLSLSNSHSLILLTTKCIPSRKGELRRQSYELKGPNKAPPFLLRAHFGSVSNIRRQWFSVNFAKLIRISTWILGISRQLKIG